MSLIYTPKYFDPRELISPAIHALIGDDGLYLFHPKVLEGADMTRKHFGPMIGNTWFSQKLIAKYGKHSFRGLRSISQGIGAPRSAHKLGYKKTVPNPIPGVVGYSAVDLVPLKTTAPEVREAMAKDQKFWSQYFTRMETHVRRKIKGKLVWVPISWIHGDNKPTGLVDQIKFFKA